jgi:protoporphyrin/coproporphyrin ferrochelatase
MSSNATREYDAFLLVSFGGPEGPDEVMPFLENVVRGRNVPRARLEAVAEHYHHFGGRSPINEQNRALIAAMGDEFKTHGIELPIYFGNRNWRPYIADALRQMQADGVRRALAFFTSVFSCYSSCRQYREDVEAARREIGDDAPVVEKLRPFFDHPGFVEAMADRVRAALQQVGRSATPSPSTSGNADRAAANQVGRSATPSHTDAAERREAAPLVFTTHSIPRAMADRSAYEEQFAEASRLVAGAAGHERWTLAYQSRSGPPSQPWLGPDVSDALDAVRAEGSRDAIVVPIGFLSDHVEVLWDLDHEAREHAERIGLNMVRAGTVGTHPRFVAMIRELVAERIEGREERPALGTLGPCRDACPPNCCLPA